MNKKGTKKNEQKEENNVKYHKIGFAAIFFFFSLFARLKRFFIPMTITHSGHKF